MIHLEYLRRAAGSRVAIAESAGRTYPTWHPGRYLWMFRWWRACRWERKLDRLCIMELQAESWATAMGKAR